MGIKVIDDSGFDIGSYEFSDSMIYGVDCFDDYAVGLDVECYTNINRRDTIALAKHFKITQEEIEGFSL